MALETFAYDPAEFLTEPIDIFYFAEAKLEDGDSSYWPSAVAIAAKARGGFERLSEESGIELTTLHEATEEGSKNAREVLGRLMEAYRPRVLKDRDCLPSARRLAV
jgi:DNA-binding phage protein